jgi:hypothetical protein
MRLTMSCAESCRTMESRRWRCSCTILSTSIGHVIVWSSCSVTFKLPGTPPPNKNSESLFLTVPIEIKCRFCWKQDRTLLPTTTVYNTSTAHAWKELIPLLSDERWSHRKIVHKEEVTACSRGQRKEKVCHVSQWVEQHFFTLAKASSSEMDSF